MEIAAWKEFKEEDSTINCRLQLSYTDGRKVKTVLKQLKEWQQCGTGYDPKEKRDILLFVRKFQDDKSWKSFLRNFPFTISEILRNNKKKVYNAKKKKSS